MLRPPHPADCLDEGAPAPPLGGEDLPALRGEPVVAAAALAGLLHPAAGDHAAPPEPVEQRGERRDGEAGDPAGARVDQLAQLVAVAGLVLEQREDQELGAALLPVRVRHQEPHMWQCNICTARGSPRQAARPGTTTAARGGRPSGPEWRDAGRGGHGQGRDRPADTRIFSPLLYQLSYLARGRAIYGYRRPGANPAVRLLLLHQRLLHPPFGVGALHLEVAILVLAQVDQLVRRLERGQHLRSILRLRVQLHVVDLRQDDVALGVPRSRGVLRFHVASLYPLLYRLERRGVIAGRWVEKAGQRRRRYYRLTPAGRKVLAAQRGSWSAFVQAIGRVVGAQHA